MAQTTITFQWMKTKRGPGGGIRSVCVYTEYLNIFTTEILVGSVKLSRFFLTLKTSFISVCRKEAAAVFLAGPEALWFICKVTLGLD